MELILDVPNAYASVKNLDFRLITICVSGPSFLLKISNYDGVSLYIYCSPYTKFLFSVGNGHDRVCDISSSIDKTPTDLYIFLI